MESRPFPDFTRGTAIIHPPKHALATFGATTLHYVLISELSEPLNSCRLREGYVTAERPHIITSEFWQKRFEGFGDEAEQYRAHFERLYGEAFRALEYTFKNNLESSSIEQATSTELVDRIRGRLDSENALRTAILRGPDVTWSFSIMQFIVEMSVRSFPSNVRELEDRGLFDPAAAQERRDRHRIERLFQSAQADRRAVPELVEALKKSGLYPSYEDRFLGLFN